jgi:hypothetical protein
MKNRQIYDSLEEILRNIRISDHFEENEGDRFALSVFKPKNIDSSQKISESRYKYSIDRLKNKLYAKYHCGTELRNKNHRMYNQNMKIENFLYNISKSNLGLGSWDYGWIIKNIEKNGQIHVYKDKLNLWVDKKDYFSDLDRIKVGDIVYIFIGKEYKNLLPGFYMALGDSSGSENYEQNLILRFYWNILPSGSMLLMREITSKLNSLNISFRFKILKDLSYYPRSDAAVLYLESINLSKCILTLNNIYNNVKNYLNDFSSIFVKKLAPGLTVAENPNNFESFGENRCRILAESLHQINPIDSIDLKLKTIQEYFLTMKLDLDRPYINDLLDEDPYKHLEEYFL